jgi:hypothetical protein
MGESRISIVCRQTWQRLPLRGESAVTWKLARMGGFLRMRGGVGLHEGGTEPWAERSRQLLAEGSPPNRSGTRRVPPMGVSRCKKKGTVRQ